MHDVLCALNWNITAGSNVPTTGNDSQSPAASLKDIEVNLVGHSLGGALSLLYAGSFPECINGKLVLIESCGQMSKVASSAAVSLRRSVDAELRYLRSSEDSKETIFTKQYESIEEAVQARLQAVRRLPGNQSMQRSSAQTLIDRGTTIIDTNNGPKVMFRHAAALYLPSMFYSTEEQVYSMKALYCMKWHNVCMCVSTGAK